MRRRFLPRSLVLARSLLIAAIAAGGGASAHGQAQPYYWRQRVFFIPYQPNVQDPQAAKIDKVQLLVSRDAGQHWAVLQEAEPRVRGFSYHAAADGEYAFALRMADRRGKFWPEQISQPLLRIVVDTQAPAVQLSAALDPTGQVLVKYDARDVKLNPQTLRVEAQVDGADWQRVALGPPDVSQPDRLLGQVAWRPPTSGGAVKFRATVDDVAGNHGTGAAEASLAGPALDPAFGPQLAPPSGDPSNVPRDNLDAQSGASDSPAAPIDWPTNNSFAADRHRTTTSLFASAEERGSPHLTNDIAPPSLLKSDADAPPAGLVGGWERTPSPATANSASTPEPRAAAPPAASAPSPADATPWVNSLTFDLDYDIQSAGPWGVAKVSLWGTKDGGRQWQNLGVDQDNRSPMRVSVPTAGVYGFRIIVDGAGGSPAPTPLPGETPELMVAVDLSPPHAELRAAEPGQGPLVGHVLVRWTAQDENLPPRPIGLFYSAAADGPWTTIATDLENSGEYAWRLGRETPPRVFLRLEVRDRAGNVEVQQTPSAVELNLPRPTGRLRNVRPVESDATRYRTASSERPPEG